MYKIQFCNAVQNAMCFKQEVIQVSVGLVEEANSGREETVFVV